MALVYGDRILYGEDVAQVEFILVAVDHLFDSFLEQRVCPWIHVDAVGIERSVDFLHQQLKMSCISKENNVKHCIKCCLIMLMCSHIMLSCLHILLFCSHLVLSYVHVFLITYSFLMHVS